MTQTTILNTNKPVQNRRPLETTCTSGLVSALPGGRKEASWHLSGVHCAHLLKKGLIFIPQISLYSQKIRIQLVLLLTAST